MMEGVLAFIIWYLLFSGAAYLVSIFMAWEFWRKRPPSFLVYPEFKLEDFWIGVFWRKSRVEIVERATGDHYVHCRFDMWICLIPCFPIHILVPYEEEA